MIRVFIFAGTVARGRALAELFEEDDRFEVVGTATPSHALSNGAAAFANVLVAAGVAPGQLPLEGTIVLLTDNPQPAGLGEHMKAWLPSDCSAAELMAAVTAAANDLTVLTAEQAKRWLPIERRVRRGEGTVDTLTSRELEVLRLLAEGLGNKDIAGQLGMSDHTAKFHVAQILAKLGAASRTEAVSIAIRQGLIPV